VNRSVHGHAVGGHETRAGHHQGGAEKTAELFDPASRSVYVRGRAHLGIDSDMQLAISELLGAEKLRLALATSARINSGASCLLWKRPVQGREMGLCRGGPARSLTSPGVDAVPGRRTNAGG